MLTRRGFLAFLLSGLAFVAASIGYPLSEAMATPRVTRLSLMPRRWTSGLKLRIVALADFHACDPWMTPARIKAICNQANALDPDIILLLGDYVAGMKLVLDYVDSGDWAEAMAGLQAPLGVHAILGNHDYWQDLPFQRDPSVETFCEKALRGIGISVHINSAARLEKDGEGFWIAGLGDQMALKPGREFRRKVMAGVDDLDATLAQISDDAPVILMAHEPDVFDHVSGRVSLTLSGHTHGGQFNLFGWRPFAASTGSRRYPAGHYRNGGRDLIVSKGLGCTALPLRIGSKPEIVLIEIGSAH